MTRFTSLLRTALAVAAAAAITSGISGCAADPAPPPLVTEEEAEKELERLAETTESATSTSERPRRIEVNVGVDPVRAGFNPHLAADEQATVRAIADLVLPSAYVGGQRNPDLLVAASPLTTSPAAMTVRYVIAPEAQWSDGTPISGADFVYLWRAMRSTPGTVNPHGYDAIADVRVSGAGGKTVDVDFRTPVRDVRSLFTHLLPSHLLAADGSDSATALHDAIPASAGRFLFSGVDRGRGTITLNRNDRFWGPAPARIDILNLQPARTTTQTADQLRAGQLAFVDMAPEETTRRVLELVPNTQLRTVEGPRTLGVSILTGVPFEARRELTSLIDAPLLASIATNRSTDLALPTANPSFGAPPAGALNAYVVKQGTLRIAADAADPAAVAAGKSLVDLLNAAGVRAQFVGTDTGTIMSKLVPTGAVDAVVGWRLSGTGADAAIEVAGRAACPTHVFSSANISGFCDSGSERLALDVLAGAISPAEAAAILAKIEAGEALWVPIVGETRLVALGRGIEGPDPKLENWTGGLATAPSWRAVAPASAGKKEPQTL